MFLLWCEECSSSTLSTGLLLLCKNILTRKILFSISDFQVYAAQISNLAHVFYLSHFFYDDLSLCHVHTTYTLGYSIRKLNKSRNSREETIKRRNEFNFIPLAFVASSLSSDRVSSAFASDPSQHSALLLQENSDIKNSNRDLNSLETSRGCYLPKNTQTQQLNSNPFQPSSTENVSPSINKQPRKFWTFSEATSTIVRHGDFLKNKKKNLEFSLNLLLRVSRRSSKVFSETMSTDVSALGST